MADNRLIERLVERQVAKHVSQLEAQLSVQQCLLTELVRHLPRHAVLDAARSLHALRMQNQPCEGAKWTRLGNGGFTCARPLGLWKRSGQTCPRPTNSSRGNL